jgi:hypothetical protein
MPTLPACAALAGMRVPSRPLPSLANRTTLPAMVATMVIRVPLLSTYATVKHVDVSLPLVACLLDGEKCMDPRNVRPLEGQELRRARAPSVCFLVKLAMRAAAPPGRE